MPIKNVQPPRSPDDKFLWGYDTEAEQWVPVDRQAYEGSTLGNLARAAGRGVEDIFQGVRELSTGQTDENLQARQAAAARGAPIAESVGGFAPEVAAAGATALATGGLGFLPALALESGAAGLTSALRPGTIEERLISGLESAGLNMIGGAALKGIVQGFKVGRGVLSATQNRVAAGVEAGETRVAASRAAADAAANENAPAVAPGRSVGAAETPATALDQEIVEQGAAMDVDEAVGANVSNPSFRIAQDAAENLGYKPRPGSGTKGFSATRKAEAWHEMRPDRALAEQRRMFDNNRLLTQTAAKSIGIEDVAQKDTIEIFDLATTEGRLGNLYQEFDRVTPGISGDDFVRAVKPSLAKGGFFDPGRAQSRLAKAVENAQATPGAKMTGEQTLETLRLMKSEAMDALNRGDQHGAEALMNAQFRLTDLVEGIAKRQGKEDLVERIHQANQQWRIAKMLEAPGVLSPQGEINPQAMFRQMVKARSRGGYGTDGPQRGTPERDLWNLVLAARREATGVPMTGARALIYAGGRQAGKMAAGGVGLGAAANVLGLWD